MIAIQPTWTQERVEQLKSYFEAGLSCRDIALNIGISRNAVIGKLSRLNLTRGERRRRKKSAGPTQTPTAKQQLLMLQEAYDQPADNVPIVSANSCSLFELTEQRCRWPISTPGAADFCFCGNTPLGGMPYCPGHYRLAYQAGSRQRAAYR